MSQEKPHLWQGQWLADSEFEARLASLGEVTAQALAEGLPTARVLDACAALGERLRESSAERQAALGILQADHGLAPAEAVAQLEEIAAFLGRDGLEEKLRRELGSIDPLTPTRIGFRVDAFECYAPLGILAHVAPTNAATVGSLSVVEGLLAGNVNLLKTGGQDSLLAQHILAALGACDPSGGVARHIIAARIPSRDEARLRRFLAVADGVAVWGSEEAVSELRRLMTDDVRFIEWGPKISFAYVAASHAADPATFAKLADEIILVEQQACASPQVVYLETADKDELARFGARLAAALGVAGARKAPPPLSSAEQAEITSVTEVTRLESHLGLTQVLTDAAGSYRVLVDYRPALRASPLYRTIWVKPLPQSEIVTVLRPMRRYLQTAGLACRSEDYAALVTAFVGAGVLRIAELGSMLSSYAGEPHDGVYALPRYAQRISLQTGATLAGVAALGQLLPPQPTVPKQRPVLTKAEFQTAQVDDAFADLYFKSGGSSGDPKLSIFAYDDYHRHMLLAARGLYAAGLDPGRDRCMNLFFAGGLYGGFISFFSVLEMLTARQFPMAAHADTAEVVRTIVEKRVNVLLGMPSYIIQLFQRHADQLAAYRGVEKIFYGGEHFTPPQCQLFQEKFGVALVKSATYGSVDAGPLGYQCRASEGSVHHLHSQLHGLEILQLDSDQPVAPDETGRLVFTSKVRRGQNLDRYEIGDVGRWVADECACGIKEPRFELLGRHGDVFRIGTMFLNYRRFVDTLGDALGYAGEVQLVLAAGAVEELQVLVDKSAPEASIVARALLARDHDLWEAVEQDRLLRLTVRQVPAGELQRTPGSGKLRGVIDLRIKGGG